MSNNTNSLSKKPKAIVAIVGGILLCIIGIVYLKQSKRHEKPLYTTQKPERQNITQYVTATGTLQAKDQITVGSLVDGRVIKLYVDDNDVVKKDQVLLELDNGIGDSNVKRLQALLMEQKAELLYQKAFYERQKELFLTGQIAQDTYEQYARNYQIAEARVKQTKANLEIQQKEYDNLFIKSPDDGIVIARKVDLGQMVTSRLQATVLFIIAKDLTEMEAHINAEEADVGLIKQGQEVTFKVDSFPKRTYNAKVKQIQYLAQIIDKVVTYSTILEVDNPDLTLRPGMTTSVDIKVAHADNALCVPNKAFRINSVILKNIAQTLGFNFQELPKEKEEEEESLWVVENETFKQIKITQGVATRRLTQIVSGVDENTQVLTEIVEPPKENILLKSVFGRASGGIGKQG